MSEPLAATEYIPFDMNCGKCEYSEGCFPVLKLLHRAGYPCRQGRKKKTVRQCTIAEAIEKCQKHHQQQEVVGE
jgi:hypothetical protein